MTCYIEDGSLGEHDRVRDREWAAVAPVTHHHHHRRRNEKRKEKDMIYRYADMHFFLFFVFFDLRGFYEHTTTRTIPVCMYVREYKVCHERCSGPGMLPLCLP